MTFLVEIYMLMTLILVKTGKETCLVRYYVTAFNQGIEKNHADFKFQEIHQSLMCN